MISRQDQYVRSALIADEVEIAPHRIGVTALPATPHSPHVGLQQAHAAGGAIQIPGFAHADVVVQGTGHVLGQNPNVVQLAVGEIAQRKVDQPELAADVQGRLGPGLRERAQGFAGAPRHDEGQDTV